MYTRYLNLDFWFYQIYLLFKAIASFNFQGGGLAGLPSLLNSLGLLVFLFFYLGFLIYGLLYYNTLAVLGTFLLLGLLSLFLFQNLSVLSVLAFYLLLFLLYSLYRHKQVEEREQERFLSSFIVTADPKTEQQEEWQDILDHVDSENESQWKLALIDADKILEDLLKKNGFDGDGVGERLKNAEGKGGLKSLQDAWEAHKIRNRIAHEAGFELTKREARRAVELYKKVFEELGFI